MRLQRFSINNYRSIRSTQRLAFGRSTTLIGPNNEGKSNIVRAIVCALNTLRLHAERTPIGRVASRPRTSPIYGLVYKWDYDYPINLQDVKNSPPTRFFLEFNLNAEEQQQFGQDIGSKINEYLPIEIVFNEENEPSFKVAKQGKGAAVLSAKSRSIAEFVGKRIDINHIPAVRKSEDARSVVEKYVTRALDDAATNPEYEDAMRRINEIQAPILAGISEKIKGLVSELLPEVVGVEIEISQQQRIRPYRDLEIIIDDGLKTTLDHKGDGVISLVAMGLLSGRVGESRDSLSTILAVEEPEAHLHPRAVHAIRQTLENMSNLNQVIITTHSPLLINRSSLSSNIIVQGNEGRTASSISEIRDILGVRVNDNLTNARCVLLCEGECDRRVLTSILESISESVKKWIVDGDLIIQSIGGASKLPYHVNLLRNGACEVVCFLDDDGSGNSAYQSSKSDNLLNDSEVVFARALGKDESELEDLFDQSKLCDFINDKYAIDISLTAGNSKRRKFSDRLATCLQRAGRPNGDDAIKDIKIAVAEWAVDTGYDVIAEYGRGPISSLAELLERALNPTSHRAK